MKWTSYGCEDRNGKLREYVSGKTDEGKWTKRSRASKISYKPGASAKTIESKKSKARAEASKWMEKLNKELDNEEKRGERATKARDLTVYEYVEKRIDLMERNGTVEYSTITTYRSSAVHIKEGFEGVKVCELDADRIEEWLGDLAESGYGTSVRRKAFRLLRQCLKHATITRVIDRDPTEGIKQPPDVKVNEGSNALDKKGRNKLDQCFKNLANHTPTTAAATIALWTGLREGEICALRWSDIDFAKGFLWVHHAIGRGKGGCYEKDPKTHHIRNVAMSEDLSDFLMEWKREQFEVMGPDEERYVLCNADGRFIDPNAIGKNWSLLSRSFGLVGSKDRPVTFHDLRHTWATLAIESGVDVKTAASNLGHSNPVMTLARYASESDDAKRRAAELLQTRMFTESGAE
ncbi:site-specific integrase [Paratractidigestivibacter sp.]|uniref:tyrosine-type recombinase/integrase n=1 Tax=Paratractidigestivibacter sp. TaxID=2847316 RepID=UPI002AC8B23A|nr:site-specific integrase [Paratractidigestivibacter sp.]